MKIRLMLIAVIAMASVLIAGFDGGTIVLRSDRSEVTTVLASAVKADTSTGIVKRDQMFSSFWWHEFIWNVLSLSATDSTYVKALIYTRDGENDTWRLFHTFSTMATGKQTVHFFLNADVDTAFASGGHIGDQLRVDYIMGDSTNDVVRTVSQKSEMILKAK